MTNKHFNEKLVELLDSLEQFHFVEMLFIDLLENYNIDSNRKLVIQRIYSFLESVNPNIKKLTLKTLICKGDEYDIESDRLISFKKMYKLNMDLYDTYELNPKKVLLILASKHVIWCIDYLNGNIEVKKSKLFFMNWYNNYQMKKKILEHFGDVLNYMILLYLSEGELE